jgi:hypothetical protein
MWYLSSCVRPSHRTTDVSGDGVGSPCCLLCGGLLRGGLLRGGLLHGGLLHAGLLRGGLLRVRRLFSGPLPFRPVHSLLLTSMSILSLFCNAVISTNTFIFCSYSGLKYYDYDLESAFFPFFIVKRQNPSYCCPCE